MYVYCIYSTYILYRSVCPLVVQSHTIQDEVLSPLTPRKYIVLNGNSVFDLRDVFQERNPRVRNLNFPINRFVFVTEKRRVLCETGTEYLYVVQTNRTITLASVCKPPKRIIRIQPKCNNCSTPYLCCIIPTVHFPSLYLASPATFITRTSGHCLGTFRAFSFPTINYILSH